MQINRANSFLRSAATEHEGGGGGSPTTTGAAAASGAPPAATGTEASEQAEEPARPPTLIEKVEAGLRRKDTILAENNDLKIKATTAEAEVVRLTQENTALREQVTTFQANETRLATALEKSEGERQTVNQAAATQVAAIGFPEAALPSSATEDNSTLDALEAKMATATDPKEKFRLAKQIRAESNKRG